MDTVRNLGKSLAKKWLLLVLVSVLLLTATLSQVAWARANENDKKKIVRQVAQKWIQVGTEQYNRGFFKAAEQSFLRAQDYEGYLTAAERERLTGLLEKTHLAVLERELVLEHIETADELIKRGQLIKAKAHLEKVKDSKSLTQTERGQIAEGLKKIAGQLNEQKEQIAELYNLSVGFYRTGQIEKAREGFLKVAQSGLLTAPAGKTAEDYLVKIDDILIERTKPLWPIETRAAEKLPETTAEAIEDEFPGVGTAPGQDIEQQVVQEQKPAAVAVTEPSVAEPVTSEGGYIEVVNRKRNILRSHTRAVVNDSVAKVRDYISRGEFDKAREAIAAAERIVNGNPLQLGDDLFKEYSSILKELADEMFRRESETARQLEKQKRSDAISAQLRYRERTEIDRSRRIAELMNNSTVYQRQQRYEEALGQLESLLAIAPLNDQALILKQTLEDTISFRKQLELWKEADKEKTDILLKTDEARIPYAEELVYPKNWREIVAKRKPEEAIGLDPATVAVYKQLDEIVDLSELMLEMSFKEAIGELRNAVAPPLKIVVLWRDLYDNADIEQTTPISMEPISAVPLGRALDILLKSVSGGFAELGYVIEGGVITVATVESLPSELVTQVYDVTDLLGRPADFFSRTPAGGGGGGGDVQNIGGGFQEEEEEEIDREQLLELSTLRADNLVLLIQDTIEPDSWYDVGVGEGTITVYENKKLVVRQSLAIHNKIRKLLKEMRKSLGHQVSIEARFLLVGENFLEDIGLDVDFRINLGGKLGFVDIRQDSMDIVRTDDTGVPGTFSGFDVTTGTPFNIASTIGGSYGSILDDLQVSFLLRATQAHRDATSLTAPKVSVLSGESASLRVERLILYAGDIEIETQEMGEFGRLSFNVNYEDRSVTSGTILNVTPTITPDKKNVLLNIEAVLTDFLGFRRQVIDVGYFGGDLPGAGEDYTIEFPQVEVSRVQTRVSVPDGGTLLLGGQKLAVETERESGVPILSKIPFIGRLFSNRTKVKDSRILLILVKPTIILQEEAEAEAIAAMEGGF